MLDADLCKGIDEIEAGLVDAVLARGLIKKRISRKGQGKSGGYRTIIAFQEGERAFFLAGFAKKDKANISQTELVALCEFAEALMGKSDVWIKSQTEQGALEEISHETEQ